MIPIRCGIIACVAVAMAAASAPVHAQGSGSELPGRARERFQGLPPPLAEPAGTRISLPSTVAPPGADRITLTLSRIIVTGSTVYRPEDFDAASSSAKP